MTARARPAVTAVVLSALLGAMGAVAAGAVDPLLFVDGVEVQVRPSTPPAVFVRVHGLLMDGCSSVGTVSQQRDGRRVTVTIRVRHTGATTCTMIGGVVDEIVRLEGSFGPGDYTLTVNGLGRDFRL